MKVTKQEDEARQILEAAIDALDEQETRIQALGDDTPEEERKFHEELFESRKEDVDRARDTLKRLIALRKARETVPPDTSEHAGDGTGQTGGTESNTRAGMSVKEPLTYRKGGPFSFFSDLYNSAGNPDAQARLARHSQEMAKEHRALSTTVTAGGNFVPPVYLGDMYAELARPGRPFADAVPSSALMENGMSITIPRITTGTLVAVQATQNASIGTQDIVEALLTVPVVTIAGYVDLSVQLLERSDPSMDQIIFNDLRSDYDRLLDFQLLNGTGGAQHVGIRQVASINTVTYTAATPTSAALLPKLYDGVQQIASNRYADPETIVFHPRRSAWLASNLSSTFPLFQQGQLNQAVGQQNRGFVNNPLGLNEVRDANVTATQGAGTNEDEIYIVRVSDLHLWEGPLRAEVFRDVGSATATVRLRLYGYSAFASGRFPKSITKISGTGLAAPVF